MNKIAIEMLPVEDGDCIYVEFLSGDNSFRILIDCGRVKHWESVLQPFFQTLKTQNKRLNLLVITHIDSDHIGGAIPLLESEYADLIDEIWYNGLEQVCPNAVHANKANTNAYQKISSCHQHTRLPLQSEISAKQGISLSQAIEQSRIPLNRIVNRKSITSETPSFSPMANLSFDFLLPKTTELDRLKELFEDELWNENYQGAIVICNASQEAYENLHLSERDYSIHAEEISRRIHHSESLIDLAQAPLKADTSKTNASSIAFCVRFFDYTLLFAGDAHADSLLEQVKQWSENYQQSTTFDVIKLPHHGSYKNCGKLLEEVDAKYFLISTNGSHHRHPDKETLASVITRPVAENRMLFFNYPCNKQYQWLDALNVQEQYSFSLYSGVVELEQIESRRLYESIFEENRLSNSM